MTRTPPRATVRAMATYTYEPDISTISRPMPPPRRVVLSEKRMEQIIDAAATGVPPEVIGHALGLTHHEWAIFRAQCYEVDEAIATGRAVGQLEMASCLRANARGGDTKAALALLTHRFGWKDQATDDANNIEKAKVMMDYSKLSTAELESLRAIALKAQVADAE